MPAPKYNSFHGSHGKLLRKKQTRTTKPHPKIDAALPETSRYHHTEIFGVTTRTCEAEDTKPLDSIILAPRGIERAILAKTLTNQLPPTSDTAPK